MDGVGAGVGDRRHDAGNVQVAFGGGRRADGHRLVGHAHVQRVLVGLGMDRDGGDPHAPRRAHHATRDLAPVGDQDFGEHGRAT